MQVFYIADGDVHRLLVDLAVGHIEVDEQFVIIECPIEVQFGQFAVVADRRIVGFVSIGIDIGCYHKRNDFIHHLAVGVFEDALVIDGEDRFHDAGSVEFELLERQVGYQPHLIAHERCVIELLDEGLRQGLFEDNEFIDVSFEAVATEVHRAAHSTYEVCFL